MPDQTGKKQDDPLVYVVSAPNETIANMWADILQQNGINVLIKHGPVTTYAATFGEPIEIHALASQASEAKQILLSLTEAENPEPEE